MLKFYADKFLRIARSLEGLRRESETVQKNLGDHYECSSKTLQTLILLVNFIIKECEKIELRVSALSGKEVAEKISHQTCEFRKIKEGLGDLQRTIEREISTVLLLRVPTEKVGYFQVHSLFGERVYTNFCSARYDIEEAGNCFASSRNTATVFHLMRVLEIGLRALYSALDMTPLEEKDRNWGTIIEKINGEIEIRDKAKDPQWKTAREFYLSAVIFFDRVRKAWRNDTMHVEGKDDEADAERIYNAVKSFMGEVAENINEKGKNAEITPKHQQSPEVSKHDPTSSTASLE